MRFDDWLPRITRLARPALAVYWPAIFLSTHWPNVRISIETPAIPLDKLAHFSLYAGLSLLLVLATGLLWSRRDPVGRPPASHGWPLGYLAVAALVLAYACFDEVTQPLVDRDFEWLDLLADSLGLGLVLIAARAWSVWRTSLLKVSAGCEATRL